MAKLLCNVISYTLRRTVDVQVILPTPTIPESMGMGGSLPPRHTPKDKYPVLYLLHGMGNNHAQWTGYTNVELYAEERQIAVVMISGENKSYVNHKNGDLFYDFIAKELPDFVCGLFPVSLRPEDTYIAGLSMGGYGALIHGLSAPQRFAAIGAFSPATHINPAAILEPAGDAPPAPEHSPIALAARVTEQGTQLPPLYISCGTEDFLYSANVDFVQALQKMEQPVTWSSVPGYGHAWRFWDREIERFMDWLPRTDAYAGAKRQV